MNFTDQLGPLAVGIALGLEQNMFSNVNSDYLTDNGHRHGRERTGQPARPERADAGLSARAAAKRKHHQPGGKQRRAGVPAPHQSQHPGAGGAGRRRHVQFHHPGAGPGGSSPWLQGQTAWDTGADDELTAMQSTETLIAGNIATRAGQLQSAAQQTALTYGVITVVVLLIVLLAALAVARSLVLPLRRLRAGALNIASVQLPERVKLLTESPDAAASMVVAPINVTYKDEIGDVARAFDQVHAEAVRLAGEQALLRSTFNAMFVNLSRRSQALIERLARMIDNLEQTEADPDRLGHLFSMDHLVTRMRRNSENLLLLAGHENPRKWSEPVPLADVARAAISEIEQYNRITLNIPPGIAVVGGAVSDVAHLLAELIENATMFSAKDTQVQVVMQELSSGGVLIEISDKGIGVSEERLADMNWRLDNRADHRRVRLPAHGPVRGGATGRAARGPGPAAAGPPARAVGPGLAIGQRHRADEFVRVCRRLAESAGRRRARRAVVGGDQADRRDARGRRSARAQRQRERGPGSSAGCPRPPQRSRAAAAAAAAGTPRRTQGRASPRAGSAAARPIGAALVARAAGRRNGVPRAARPTMTRRRSACRSASLRTA